MEKIKCNIGFDGRVFLTLCEWETYKKQKPVRYINKMKKFKCEICGLPPKEGNTLQNSHIIGFGLGIIYLGLTPDYVNKDQNIISAHSKECNNTAELDLSASCKKLKECGIDTLPEYLPSFVHQIFDNS